MKTIVIVDTNDRNGNDVEAWVHGIPVLVGHGVGPTISEMLREVPVKTDKVVIVSDFMFATKKESNVVGCLLKQLRNMGIEVVKVRIEMEALAGTPEER